MKPNENSFTRELDSALKEAGINRSELARRMGGQPALISRWGGSVFPTPKTIQRIAAALQTNVERFLRTLPTDPYRIHIRESVETEPPARVQQYAIRIREPAAEYRASPVNQTLQHHAEQTAAEIRDRLLLMCQATAPQREAFATQCRNRIDEFLATCAIEA